MTDRRAGSWKLAGAIPLLVAAFAASAPRAAELRDESRDLGSFGELIQESQYTLRQSLDALSESLSCSGETGFSAPEPSPLRRQFCESPASLACSDGPVVSSESRFDGAIENLSRKIKIEAIRGTADPSRGIAKACQAGPADPGCRSVFDGYIRSLQSVINRRLQPGQIESAAREASERARRLMSASIDQMAKDRAIESSDADALKRALGSVRVLTLSDLPRLGEPEHSMAMLSFFENCGPSGTVRGAFSAEINHESPAVMVCPGTLIALAGRSKDEARSDLVGIYSYEIGKAALTGPQHQALYSKLVACVKEHAGAEAAASLERGPGPEATIADLWMMQARLRQMEADLLSTPGRGFLPTDDLTETARRLMEFRREWKPICGVPGEVSPESSARLNALLKLDPAFPRVMACPSAARPDQLPAASCPFLSGLR